MPSEIAKLNTYLELVEIGLRQVFDGQLKTHDVLYKGWLRETRAKEWIEDEQIISAFQSMPAKGVGQPFTIDRPILGTAATPSGNDREDRGQRECASIGVCLPCAQARPLDTVAVT